MSSLPTPDPARKPARPLRVLLAEDNATNQKLAVCLLEKHGHSVVVASDGQQAVEAAGRESFDLILMDVQMPVMDGLEATAGIREQQRRSGLTVPIIALTANALIGDRERCLAAGMDDYVTKPLNARCLFSIIERILKTGSGSSNPQVATLPAEHHANDSPPFDPNSTLVQVGNDPELMAQLVAVFLQQLPRLLPPLADSIAQRDPAAIRQAAHALCSSISVLAAPRAKEAVRRVELMGLKSSLDEIEAAHEEALDEVSRLERSLNQWISRKAA